MNISLTPELENRIKAKVATGFYNNASEVVREALRFVEMNQELIDEVKLATLRKQLDAGMNELDQGKGIEIESDQALDQFFDDIQQHRID